MRRAKLLGKDSAVVTIRVRQSLRDRMVEAADRRHMTLSAWLRDVAIKALG